MKKRINFESSLLYFYLNKFDTSLNVIQLINIFYFDKLIFYFKFKLLKLSGTLVVLKPILICQDRKFVFSNVV